jgi:hypothetical protein
LARAVGVDSLPRMPRRPAALLLAAATCALALTVSPAPAIAQGKQVSTTALIQRGSELFDDQQYEESIQTLSAALVRPGSTVQERVEIYRLLAYNFITLKRTEEADSAVRGLLVLDEKFSLPPTESPRFRDFFDATRKKWEEEGKPGKAEEGTPKPVEVPVQIVHRSPAQVPPDTTIKLTGSVSDSGGRAKGVQLAYRTGAKGKFVTVPASFTLGQFRAQIPAASVKPPLVEYYLQAVDQGGLPIASRGDATAPLRIAVPSPESSGGVLSSPWFWIPVGVVVVGGAIATAIIVTNVGNTSTVSVRVTE